jgi:16S rRNA (cytosine967-C5)-methyltransferase
VTDPRQGARLRAAAAEVVDAVVTHGRSLDDALQSNERRAAAADGSVLRLLCYGTLRHHWQLKAWTGKLLDRPLKRRDSVIEALLAVGLYQLRDTRIPDHAAVSQTVEATRILRRPKLAPLVNAILRRSIRDRIFDTEPSDEEVRYNHPQWMLDRLAADWPDDWKSIVAANNDRAPMWLRVNTLHHTVEEYRARLLQQDIVAEPSTVAPQALRLLEPMPVDALPGFADGHVSVQDAAAQLASLCLDGQLQGRVLDACAAPGGKSGHLLELAQGKIDLTCMDNNASRLEDAGDNLARLGLDATLVAADASKPQEWWDGAPYDAILLDAPCSASGVIRRHPDIKLLRRQSDIGRLAATQLQLLAALWPLLAPGGRLLYVTCSVFAEENDRVVARFLESRDDAREEEVLQDYNIRDVMRHKACGYQVLPGVAGMDGFYYAGLKKIS